MVLAYHEHYTVRDYQLWEGNWELIHGAPYAMTPSPGISHQFANGELFSQLNQQLKSCNNCTALIEVDWHCSDDTIVRPDTLVACNIEGERLTLTPELIIEIVSPGNAKRDETIKMELYESEGVKTYILVYPEIHKAKAYRLIEGKYQKISDFHKDTLDLSIKQCPIGLDFSEIWR